jgi:hypothetical protein
MERFTALSFLLRWLFALALVLLTFNPSGYSYYHWLVTGLPKVTPVVAVCGLLLLIGWIVFIGATLRSIGTIGVLLAAALFAALLWLLVSQGWLDLGNTLALVWIALVVLSLLLAVGMSWSHVNRRLTGQADVDPVDGR